MATKTIVRGWAVEYQSRFKPMAWKVAYSPHEPETRVKNAAVLPTRHDARCSCEELDRLYGDHMRYRIRRATVTLEIE
jgi:hypothetical protein